ncbi:uncharacterized protein LOC105447325 [Strongylocentrotus purpuratus]|uniref:F5/8 type C domain-containing protein n=1 Tax=Strongylocentrotus purpuratus TaxID=7668 RepID=A0A7M7NJE1_STRPU|nr:uncharacterized protein LOC105447325 [Strongylocentrotus purpuratus]
MHFETKVCHFICCYSAAMPSNVRIVEGASLTKGRIEIFDPVDTGVWGTVCRSSEINTRTGELLADQLGQYGFDRFGSDGEFPESLYVATVKNPHCNSKSLNILNCFEQGGTCDVTHVGIKFTESSLGLCEGTVLEDSESQCSCHKTITKAYSNSCLGYGTVCSPSFISHTGDIDVYLYTPPNDDPVETNGETTTGDVRSPVSPTSQREITAEETAFAESIVGETTLGEVTSKVTTLSETTIGETTSPETTLGKTTAEETTFAESTVKETNIGEVTTEVTTFSETTIGETTSPETTPGNSTAEETTFAESTVEETTIGEVTTEVTTFSETTIGETTSPETTPGKTTAEETTFAESTVKETTIREVATEATTLPETMHGETTLAEVTVRDTTVGEVIAAETTLAEVTVRETTVGEVNAAETMTGEVIASGTTLGEATATEPTAVNNVAAWNTEIAPFTEGIVLPGTDVTVLFSEALTPEFPSVGYGSSVTLLPLATDYGFNGNLQLATTKHCGSLDCPKNLQYSDRAEPVDLRSASISASTSKAIYNPEKAFLQQLIADPLDLDYLLDNILGDYEDFNGWRAKDDDVNQPYIRVDFDRTVTVQGVIILGGQESSARVTSLKIAYTDTRETAWKYYHEDSSTESVVFGLDYTPGYAMLMFNQWHEARGLILLPQTWKGEIWMRIFVLGATYEGGAVPLGMQSGEIASAQISASSYLDEAHAPGEGRFNGPSAWCAAPAESKPWIKIDLLTHAHIDKFVVHGLVNTPVDYPAASGSYPTELKFKTSVVDDFYSYVDVELQGNSANSAEDVQEYITTWDPVARYIRIKILSSNTAFNCLRVEIYGYMNFEKWPDFNSTHLDDHIEYATDEDIHLECSCFTNPPIETYKEDYYFFLSGTEISNTFCPGHTRQWDTSAVTPSSAWPETGSGLSPVTESATTGFIFTDIFSVDITSPAAHGMTSSSSSSWLCPDVPPDMVFTSTVIYREALTIRGGHVKLNYFLRGDDRTSWTLIMRVWTEITSGSWAHEDEVIAEVHGSPGGGSPGEWREFHHERQFSEKYQLIAVFTIVADGYSMVAIEADSFHLVSDSFIGAKETNLGMQNLNILDRQIASSSERDPNTSAISARLFDGTGWCPDGNDVDPWIQRSQLKEEI